MAPRSGEAKSSRPSWKLVVAVGLATVLTLGVAGAVTEGLPPDSSGEGGAASENTRPGCTVSRKLVPSCGAWWGVAPNPLAGESWDRALVDFERLIRRPVGIAHYYVRGGTLFPTASQRARAREPGRNRLLLVNWKPSTRHTWAEIADGAVDGRIDRLAAHIKATFPERFFLAVYHEPENNLRPKRGSGYTARDYRAMYRHVVLRLRARGVHNAVTVMNYMGLPQWGTKRWFDDLYPGDDVVDWIAQDPYSFGRGVWRARFGDLVDRRAPRHRGWPGFYTWATTNHPDKPIMLAEWGVDEIEGDPSFKAAFFDRALAEMKRHPQVKAMVYWNQNEFPVGTTRIDTSPESLRAYRRLSSRPYLSPPVP